VTTAPSHDSAITTANHSQFSRIVLVTEKSLFYILILTPQLYKQKNSIEGLVKEQNKFHIYETEKITRKASDAAEYIELFGSFTRDRHARRI